MRILELVRHSPIVNRLRQLLPNELVNRCFHLPTAVLANLRYGFPSKQLKVIGVTGTDGKTTTATMIYQLLHQAEFKVALISTVAAYIGDQEIDTGFHVTSPSPFPLQSLLRQIVDRQYTHVILEATSHGLAQYRLWGVHFEGGVLTNITEDHLDYHGTMEAYAQAKALLFQDATFAVLNKADAFFEVVKGRVKGKVITYGCTGADWNLDSFRFEQPMIGDYNRLNALAAAAAAAEIGVKKPQILAGLKQFAGVRGRMQVMYDRDFMVIVDFAHTPNALNSALAALRAKSKSRTTQSKIDGRMIAVFGCAGQRDRNRRKMGKISATGADITIITAEDPRTEGVEAISDEIASWAQKGGAVFWPASKLQPPLHIPYPIYVKIPDRQRAIDTAVNIARTGDIVGIFGKGHEKSMCFGTVEHPWTDQEAVQRALTKRAGSAV